MKAIAYCRVSTDEQAKEGVSLDVQADKARRFCELHDHDLLDVRSDDGISGKSINNRPALQSCLDDVCEQKGLLIVYSISRLGRNTRDIIGMTERIRQAGAQFCSITERIDTTSATGVLFFNIMAVFAQFERDLIVERTNAAMEHIRENGGQVGNTPYGFEAEERLNPGECKPLRVNQAEMKGLELILSEAVEARIANRTVNCAEIARKLADAGIPPRTGVLWDRGVIRRIIQYHAGPNGALLRSQHDIEIGALPGTTPAQSGEAV